MARTRRDRAEYAQEFLRTLSAWARKHYGSTLEAGLPEVDRLVRPALDSLLDRLALWVERGASDDAVRVERARFGDALEEAKKIATSRRSTRRTVRTN